MRPDVAMAPADGKASGYMRHVRACGNAVLPGARRPFWLLGAQVGWVAPSLAEALAGQPAVETGADGARLEDPGHLPALARAMSAAGFFRWRGEAFDVRAHRDGPVLAQIDRGALPAFGIEAVGVHVNGVVERAGGPHLWIARRAADKALDPNKLDHIVAGGVPAGLTPDQTLVKEAAEEASIPPALATTAVPVATVRYAMERAEGLRRDILFCYDLPLAEDFRPLPRDGEVAGFELWPLTRVAEAVRTTDEFKFNVNLVLIDLLIRRGLIAGDAAAALRAGLARNARAP